MSAIHPFPPAELPNFVKGVKGLKETAPENIPSLDTLGFMDAGAWLNLPYLPLLRRNCDVVLALDASADSQDLWFQRAEGKTFASSQKPRRDETQCRFGFTEYADQLNMKQWPKIQYKALFEASIPEQADEPLREAKRQNEKVEQQTSPNQNEAQTLPQPQEEDRVDALEDFNIWIGSSNLKNESSRVSSEDLGQIEQFAQERDGIALVYVPLRSKEIMETWSTWRFEYPTAETEKLLKIAEVRVSFSRAIEIA